MKNSIITVSIITLLTLATGCNSSSAQKLPSQISVNLPEFYPEGITYYNNKFYLGSYYKGKIISVDFKGNVKEFTNDNTLVSVIGIHVDKERGELIVCNSDSGFGKKSSDETNGQLAEVVFFDLSNGKKLRTIDLSNLYEGGHFLNDSTIDSEGNIYVTNSFSPVIYKIDTKGKASIFSENTLFKAPEGRFGLNGIVYSKGYLIVGRADTGKLYKVSLDNPSDVKEIILKQSVNSLDGLLLQDKNTLILVSNNFTGAPFDEAVYKIVTKDDWKTAKIKAIKKIEGKVFPTTVAKVNGVIYVNQSHLPVLVMKMPPVQQFQIKKVDF